jgi:hypothetical protein
MKIFNVRYWPMVHRDGTRGPTFHKGNELPPRLVNEDEIAKMFPEAWQGISYLSNGKSVDFEYKIDSIRVKVKVTAKVIK